MLKFLRLLNQQLMIGEKSILLAASCCALLFMTGKSVYAQENILRGGIINAPTMLDRQRPPSAFSGADPSFNQYESNIPESRLRQSMPDVSQDMEDNRSSDQLQSARPNAGALQSIDLPSIEDVNRQFDTWPQQDDTNAFEADPVGTNERGERARKISGIDGAAQRTNAREMRLQAYGRFVLEEPFAAQGIRVGRFILRPTLEQGIKATSNADNSNGGKSAVISQTALQFLLASDWQRHAVNLDMRGSWDRSLSGQNISEPHLLMNADIRLDLTELDQLNFKFGYEQRRESASDPNSIANVEKRPFYRKLNSSIGIERQQGLIFGGVTAQFDYHTYDKAYLDDGTVVSQRDRDNLQSSLRLRGGYELSASFKPFLEAEIGRRSFQNKYDRNGFQRSGNEWALRAGVIIDRGEKLNGEVAIGYLHEELDDARLKNMGGLSLKGTINWSPIRGTQIRLGTQTRTEISTALYDNGSIYYLSELEIIHHLRSNLTLNTKFDLALRDYQSSSERDWTIGAQIGATYWINRFVALDARLRYERLYSDVDSREYSAKSIYGGIKLQR